MIFLGGTNDVGRGVPTSDIYAAITEMTGLPLQHKSKVLLLTVPECAVVDDDLDRRRTELNSLILSDVRVGV